ncbi:MAG: hypothetical protein FJ104_00660, partial [Deltaproteobacteria bacterium]|nr:hypothetical protein [Deltaproteobacteria bacterium]
PVRDAAPEADAPLVGTGLGPSPGVIRCGTDVCQLGVEICCAEPETGKPLGCQAADAGACAARVTCDEGADCGSGSVCCFNRYFQVGGLADVSCEVSSCFSPAATTCVADSDCPVGWWCQPHPIMPDHYTCQFP